MTNGIFLTFIIEFYIYSYFKSHIVVMRSIYMVLPLNTHITMANLLSFLIDDCWIMREYDILKIVVSMNEQYPLL